jgi:hydrogenase maturation protease
VSVWDDLRRPGARSVEVDGVRLRRGSRVRLRPQQRGGDVFDEALAGRVAIVEALETDVERGEVHVVVTLDDDPGRDLGEARQPGHRFFFALAEVEPLPGGAPPARILVAGIGNGFLGDDGFGVALAQRLLDRPQPDGVEVKDFGIRGVDLAFALADYDVVVLLDAVPRGFEPGTLSVIDPDARSHGAPPPPATWPAPAALARDDVMDAHGMDPVQVLAFARELGRVPERIVLVGCEPLTCMTGEEDEMVGELSAPVQVALAPAVRLVEELVRDLIEEAKP